MAPDELPHPVTGTRRCREDWLSTQVPSDVHRQFAGCLVATRAVFLQALHDDPIEITMEQAAQREGIGVSVVRDRGCLVLALERRMVSRHAGTLGRNGMTSAGRRLTAGCRGAALTTVSCGWERRTRDQTADPGTWLGRLDLADDPSQLVQRRLAQRVAIERRLARQQLVQEHTQRINVAARIDVDPAHLGLLGTHVLR